MLTSSETDTDLLWQRPLHWDKGKKSAVCSAPFWQSFDLRLHVFPALIRFSKESLKSQSSLFFLLFVMCLLPVLIHPSGKRPAGCVEAGARDFWSASQSEMDVEGGKSGNDTGEELDGPGCLSFGSCRISSICSQKMKKTSNKKKERPKLKTNHGHKLLQD